MKRLALALALILPLSLASCGNPATTVTPAPPQSVGLTIARSLLDAQTSIEQAKGLVATNPAIKDPLNRVIAGYNAAESAYLVYHQAIASGSTPDATALQAQVVALTGNVAALVTLFGKPK